MSGPADSTDPVRALAARYYIDPEIYRREEEGLLSRTWQFACHAAQIANAGDYYCFQIAGQDLFVVRGKDGVARCFYNVCQHRAHPLVSEQGNAKVLVCPYHAWSYELSGQLRGGPNVHAVPNFNKSSICLSPVQLEDFCGFLFVNLDSESEPMEQWFPGVRAALQEYVPQVDDLAPLEWVAVAERCNWKVSVENYSECYHCSLNHPTFATGVIKPQTYEIKPAGGYCLRHTTECQGVEAMSYDVDLAANARAGEYSSWFLWPAFSFQVYPGNILNTYHWRPQSVSEVSVVRGWYSAGGVEDATVRQLAAQDRETTVAEDIALVEGVQRGLNSRGYKPGPLVVDPQGGLNSEHSIAVLHGWMRAAIET